MEGRGWSAESGIVYSTPEKVFLEILTHADVGE
jgi:hypothetical protein